MACQSTFTHKKISEMGLCMLKCDGIILNAMVSFDKSKFVFADCAFG